MGIKLIISISLSLYSLWNLPSLVLVHISSRKVPVCSKREQNSLYAFPSVRTAPGWVLGWGQAAPTSPMQLLGSMKSYLPHVPAIGSPCSMSQESLFEPSRFTPLCTKTSENKRHFCLESSQSFSFMCDRCFQNPFEGICIIDTQHQWPSLNDFKSIFISGGSEAASGICKAPLRCSGLQTLWQWGLCEYLRTNTLDFISKIKSTGWNMGNQMQ